MENFTYLNQLHIFGFCNPNDEREYNFWSSFLIPDSATASPIGFRSFHEFALKTITKTLQDSAKVRAYTFLESISRTFHDSHLATSNSINPRLVANALSQTVFSGKDVLKRPSTISLINLQYNTVVSYTFQRFL